jgi:rhodanese-related sulfurtransferase
MAVNFITPNEFFALLNSGKVVDFIDVRTPAEYASRHAKGARLVPVDDLNVAKVLAERVAEKDSPIYIICKSGTRAQRAGDKFIAGGFDNVFCVAGGTEAWVAAGLPVESDGSKVIPLDRQVRIVAGSMVFIGAILAWLVHPAFVGLCGFVGAGLVFAGITDICPMANLVAKMPWNQRSGNCCCSGSCSTRTA